jgi:hypothetical protein
MREMPLTGAIGRTCRLYPRQKPAKWRARPNVAAFGRGVRCREVRQDNNLGQLCAVQPTFGRLLAVALRPPKRRCNRAGGPKPESKHQFAVYDHSMACRSAVPLCACVAGFSINLCSASGS